MTSSRSAAIARSSPTARYFCDAPEASEVASPITEPRLRQVYDYWRCKATGRAMPRRADIDPTEIPKLLPDVMLVDVLPQGRYRYRLIGTENSVAHGMNATGRYRPRRGEPSWVNLDCRGRVRTICPSTGSASRSTSNG